MHLTCVVLQLCFWPVVFKLFGRLPFWLILKPNYIPSKTNFSKPLKIAQPTMEEYRRHADFWSLHRYPTCGTCLLNLILSSSHKYPPQRSFYLSNVYKVPFNWKVRGYWPKSHIYFDQFKFSRFFPVVFGCSF